MSCDGSPVRSPCYAGRVAQIRAKLRRNWQAFQGETAEEAGELAMAGC